MGDMNDDMNDEDLTLHIEMIRQEQDEDMRQHANAFPLKHVSQGMELRDYFAARAMQSMIITDQAWSIVGHDPEFLARTSYRMADQMMKERDANP